MHSIPSLRVIRVVEQLIELHGKPAFALADIQQKPTEGERSVILPMALHAVGRHTEANAALDSLVQKFGDTYAYWIAMNYAYRGDSARVLHWLTRVYEQMNGRLRSSASRFAGGAGGGGDPDVAQSKHGDFYYWRSLFLELPGA